MKNLILSISFVFFSFNAFAQDSADYKFTIMGDAGAFFVSGDGYSGGALDVMGFYSITEKIQAGASLGFGFGDLEYDAAISAIARYFVTDAIFAYGEYALTDTAGEGLTAGAGYRFKFGDRIEFNPTAVYGLDAEELGVIMGFAFRF
jgi:hypothetical protein